MTTTTPKITTTNAGAPAPSDNNSLTQGPVGPILLHDHYLLEKLAQFNRERVPERIVHAKGAGAFGELEITGDISAFTRADFLQPGKKTEMLARFSTVAGEQGSPDTWRDPRGFSLKFYTEAGQLRPRRQQHPRLLRQGPDEVPGLHPLAEAAAGQRACATTTCSGTSGRCVAENRRTSGHLADGRPRPAEESWRHMDGFRSATPTSSINAEGDPVLGQVPLQDRPGHRLPAPRTKGDELAGHVTGQPPGRISTARSRRATSRPGRSKVQIMPFDDA